MIPTFLPYGKIHPTWLRLEKLANGGYTYHFTYKFINQTSVPTLRKMEGKMYNEYHLRCKPSLYCVESCVAGAQNVKGQDGATQPCDSAWIAISIPENLNDSVTKNWKSDG